eukprot:m.66653 g.66653  ORF g.66653 m.66653 type:complete len:519 (-) comp13769_c0_seq5:158-1714(-)
MVAVMFLSALVAAIAIVAVVAMLGYAEFRQRFILWQFNTVHKASLLAQGVPYIHDSGFDYHNQHDYFHGDLFDSSGPHLINAINEMHRMQKDGAGVVLTGRAFNGRHGSLFVTDPDIAQDYIMRDTVDFVKGGVWQVYGKYAIGRGMAYNEGEQWKASRKALTSLFHFGSLKGYVPTIDDLSDALVDELAASSTQPMHPGACFGRYSMAAIIGLAFGDFVDSAEMATRYHKLNESFGAFMGKHCQYGALADMLPFKETRDVQHFRAHVVQLITDAIAKLRASGAYNEPDTNGRDDMLRVLLRAQKKNPSIITDELIINEGTTFLFAGYDTTLQGLTMTMHFLSERPDVQDKILAEVESVVGRYDEGASVSPSGVEGLSYTRTCFQEAIRLFGPGAIIRVANKDTQLGGYTIPCGTEVCLYPHLVNKHPKCGWNSPDVFEPDQWQGRDTHKYSFLSFYAGNRNCIGRRFALQEATIALAKIVQRFRIRPGNTDDQPFYPVVQSTWTVPDHFRVVFEPRA